MNETLQEYVDSRGVAMRIDPAAGLIRGIKILGLQSRNGRRYLPEALSGAVALYEGAKVNVNHPKGSPLTPRDYQDRLGSIRNVVYRAGTGLFGDLQFNPKHTLAEQLVWDAEHAPENVGFSHNVEARIKRAADSLLVEAILKVQSVDLVADPATTRGLFEAAGAAAVSPELRLSDATLEQLKQHRADLVQALAEEQSVRTIALESELAQLRAAQTLAARRARLRALLVEHGLPDPDAGPEAQALVSEAFFSTLLATASDSAALALIEERAALVRSAARIASASSSATPRSREQGFAEHSRGAPADARSFARAIR